MFLATSSYRFGFNGKENDNDVKGVEGSQLDYGARIYDSRVSRWLSVDPLQQKYPGETPYFYTGGNPIYFVDPDGKDRITTIEIRHADGTTEIQTKREKDVFNYYKESAYHGRHAYYKSDIHINVFVDYRSGNRAEVVTTDFKANSVSLGIGEYYISEPFANLIKAGDRSDQIEYGSVIYGSGKNMNWSGKLPKAADGSDSYDMKRFLDLASGLRESAELSDLQKAFGSSEKLGEFLEKIEKVREAVEKIKTAIDNKPANKKYYYDRTPAPNEEGEGSGLRQSGNPNIPDTNLYEKPNPKLKSKSKPNSKPDSKIKA